MAANLQKAQMYGVHGTRKVKVTLLASEWGSSSGGLSALNRELAIQLAKFPEVEITFFLPKCSQQDKKIALEYNVEILEAKPVPGMEQLNWLCFPPDDLQIDIIVGHGAELGGPAYAIKRNKKCKWVQVVHTDPEELGMFKSNSNPISKEVEKHRTEVELCEMADHVVGVGAKLSEAFRSYLRGRKKDDNVLDFTPGVFKEFVAVNQDPSERKQRAVLVFGSGDVEDFELKGFDIAGKAIASLQDTRLVFVGAPDGKIKEIEKRLTGCGVPAKCLRVRGFIQDKDSLRRLFQEVDLVVMPSRSEGFGLAGLEAMSAGLPVLVSINSGFGEALCSVTFGSASVIESEDPTVWATAIKKIWSKDRTCRLKEAVTLRDNYGMKYDWAKQIKELVDRMISLTHGTSSEDSGTFFKKHMLSNIASHEGASSLGKEPLKSWSMQNIAGSTSTSIGVSPSQTRESLQRSSMPSIHTPDPVCQTAKEQSATEAQNQKFESDKLASTFIDLVTLTIRTPDLSDEKKESLKEILIPSVTAYMKYHRPSTLLDFDNFFGHMTKIYRTALVSVKISSLVISVKCPTLESLERLWKDYQSGCLNDIAERFLVTDELKRKLGVDNIRLKTTIEEENYLICKRAFLENSGEASITETSCQTVDSGQVEDSRWSEDKEQALAPMARAEKAKIVPLPRPDRRSSDCGSESTTESWEESEEESEEKSKTAKEQSATEVQNQKFESDKLASTFIDLVTLTIGTPDLSDEKKESLKEILKPSVTAYMKYHRPSTLLDFDTFFGHMTKIYGTALVSVKISSLVILVKFPTLESLERLWKDYQSGCLNDMAERFLLTDELKRKLGLDNIRFKTTIEEENYLSCKRAFLENSGVASITETSCQTVDSGQVEDTRWSEESSDVVKAQTHDDRVHGSRKVKVTILASEWGSSNGGLSTINRELAIQLAKFPEVEITFFLPKCNREDKKVALDHKVEIVEATPLPGFEQLDWLYFPPKDLQIDIVVGHGVKLGKRAQAIKKSKRCKWVQVVHTNPEELGMFKTYPSPISKGEEKHKTEVELCEMADHVVGVGPKLSEAFRSYLRGCKKDDHVLDFTPGVFEEFVAVNQDPSKRRQRNVLVLGHGDVDDFELKGFDIAGKAIAALQDTRLTFVGAPDGEHEEITKRLIECGVPASRLRVEGFAQDRESLKRLFQEVDLAVMPSRTEGFGLPGLEAMSAGLPVLVSRNSGFGEALYRVVFGSAFVIHTEDPAEWTVAIQNILSKDRKCRLEEAVTLRDSYGRKYNWAKQTMELVDKMISLAHEPFMEIENNQRTNSYDDQQLVSRTSLSSDCEMKADAASGNPPKIFMNTDSQSQNRPKRKMSESSCDPDIITKHCFQELNDEQSELVREILEQQIQLYLQHGSIATSEGLSRLIEHMTKTYNRVLESISHLPDDQAWYPETSVPVLQVTLLGGGWSSSAGGLSTINRELAIHLSNHSSVKVSLLVPEGACNYEEKIDALSHGITIVEAKRRAAFDRLDWLSFPPKDHFMDIVVGHGVKLGRQIQVIRDSTRFPNFKWVQVVHTAPEDLSRYKCYSNPISKGETKHESEFELCKLADLVVPVGPKLKEAYTSYLQRCKTDQDVLSITPGLFQREFGDLVAKQDPNEDGELKVLLFGRWDDQDFELKGYNIAAKAFTDQRLKNKPYHLIFVGAPEGKQEQVREKLLQRGMAEAQLTVRKFIQSREKLKDLLCEADLAIMPSKSEGFGLVALEALSAGLPILVGSRSGFAKAFENVPIGFKCIVYSDDPGKWAEAIEAVRIRHRMRLEEIKSLRASYGKLYSWKKQCEALVNTMRRMGHGAGKLKSNLKPERTQKQNPSYTHTTLKTEELWETPLYTRKELEKEPEAEQVKTLAVRYPKSKATTSSRTSLDTSSGQLQNVKETLIFNSPTFHETNPSRRRLTGVQAIPQTGTKHHELSDAKTLNVTFLGYDWGSSAGGLSTINRELAIHLSNHSAVKVSLLVPEGACNFEEIREAHTCGITIVEAKERAAYDRLDWLSIPPQDHFMDIVVGHGVKLGRQVQFIRDSAQFPNCKWVQVVHTAPEDLSRYKWYSDPISKGETKHESEVELCKLADLVVPVGPRLKEAYSSYLQRYKKDQDVLSITPGLFQREFGDLVAKQYPNEDGEFKVLLIGRGDDEDFELKGYNIAAQAFTDQRLKNKPYHLIFVGAPEGKQEEVREKLLQRGIAEAQLTVRKFIQSRDRLKDLLCEADLAIMPSKSEGFGLVALEALSAGLPILVGSKSGFAKALENVVHGYSCIVISDDPAKWADAIEVVRIRHRMRLQEIKSLRTYYGEMYSWKEQCEALVNRMQRILENGPW